MSELIQNKQFRQDQLKELIKRLHDGATVEEVQSEFDKLTTGVTATEIAEMEQALVDEGMPVADIQRLCDVHAAVFKGSIEDIHKDDAAPPELSVGHPVLTLKAENTAIQQFIDKNVLVSLKKYVANGTTKNKEALTDDINTLYTIDKHYSRKENTIFPIMEKYDITAPPQVMWGVDDEIRDKIKSVIDRLEGPGGAPFQIEGLVNEVIEQVTEMIFKEEEIMIPMVLDKFSHEDWVQIEASSADIGFTLIDPPGRWQSQEAQQDNDAAELEKAAKKEAAAAKQEEAAAKQEAAEAAAAAAKQEAAEAAAAAAKQEAAEAAAAAAKLEENAAKQDKGTAQKRSIRQSTPASDSDEAADIVSQSSATQIQFDAGALTAEEVNAILNTVPLDMTFVGADDKVKYFTQGKERVFDRPPTIIGRQVKLCHPPKSVHIVEQIVADLRSGKKDNEDFWIRMGDVFAYIRYFAVRNKAGEYLGTLEVTQDIKNITELEGEKRLRK